MAKPDPALRQWHQHSAPYIQAARTPCDTVSMVQLGFGKGAFETRSGGDLILFQTLSSHATAHPDFGEGRFSASMHGPSKIGALAPGANADVEVDGPHQVRCFVFSSRILRPLLAPCFDGDPFDFGPMHTSLIEHPGIAAMLDQLWWDSATNDAAGRLFAESCSLAVLLALKRHLGTQGAKQPADFGRRRIDRVLELIEDRLADEIGLEELAREAAVSPRHLTTLFQTAVGMPPHRWLVERRIARAQTLLCGSKRSITDVALACGFSSSQHLATAFKKRLGLSPGDLRRDNASSASPTDQARL